MKLEHKRLTYSRGDVENNIYMFTANSIVKQDGKLVMGLVAQKLYEISIKGLTNSLEIR